jgi:hypothetical protein
MFPAIKTPTPEQYELQPLESQGVASVEGFIQYEADRTGAIPKSNALLVPAQFISEFEEFVFHTLRSGVVRGVESAVDLASRLRLWIDALNAFKCAGRMDQLTGAEAGKLSSLITCALSYLRRAYGERGIPLGRLVLAVWPADQLLSDLNNLANRPE